ncbi:MAG TPA: site-2 protease family protein [Betaproteobacteria bacterium]|nr:site-2 protease family protein [Betaproteobacteria bacterium]
MDNLLALISIYALPIIFAITLHEAAHGYAAKQFGDLTAHQMGRISLNPLRHIDLVGTILVPAVTLALGGILFGWAKPVPVNFGNLRHPKKDMLWVALAGPAANLAMALFWALSIKLSMWAPSSPFAVPMGLMGKAGVTINVILMVLNLLPILPLDGGRIMVSLLPHRYAYGYSKLEPYGLMILVFLLFTGVLGHILWPLISLAMRGIFAVFGIAF